MWKSSGPVWPLVANSRRKQAALRNGFHCLTPTSVQLVAREEPRFFPLAKSATRGREKSDGKEKKRKK